MLCVVVVWCCRFKEWLHSVAIALASDDLSILLELCNLLKQKNRRLREKWRYGKTGMFSN